MLARGSKEGRTARVEQSLHTRRELAAVAGDSEDASDPGDRADAAAREEPGILDEVRQAECDRLLDDLSSVETVEELVRGLQDGTIDVSVDVLGRLLKFLRPSALPTLLQASEQEETPGLKETLRGAVRGIAEENREAVVQRHAAGRAINPRNVVRDTGLEFHPGAIRYYTEIGIWSGPQASN